MIPPVIFLVITWYFAWNALHGSRGLEAQRLEQAELSQARQQFTVVDAERSLWEAKIATLNGQSIASDMLDNEARVVLNLADPAELVVKLPKQPLPAPIPNK
jgi:cell division protein FtsB